MGVDEAREPAVAGLIDQRFVVRVFFVFAALAVLAASLSVAGKWIGRSIAMAGHSDDATVREIVIGNEVFLIPANTIRDPAARVDHAAPKLVLYLAWPGLVGYSPPLRDAFNHAGGEHRIIFATIEPETMSRDMSGRFEPIYRALITVEAKQGPAGLALHAFSDRSGFVDETLAVGSHRDGSRFVARCLTGPAAAASLAPCQRDVALGGRLSLAYRFPLELLDEWRELDAALLAWVGQRRRTAE